MAAFGWISAAVGLVLFLLALWTTLRANPGSRIPFSRNPEIVPAGVTTMRVVGGALLIFGAVALSATIGAWAVAVALAGPVIALVAIAIHNRRLAFYLTLRTALDEGIGGDADRDEVQVRPPLITTFDGVNWIPTSWGALGVVAVLALLVGVIFSWLS
jgi:hypothetical protein